MTPVTCFATPSFAFEEPALPGGRRCDALLCDETDCSTIDQIIDHRRPTRYNPRPQHGAHHRPTRSVSHLRAAAAHVRRRPEHRNHLGPAAACRYASFGCAGGTPRASARRMGSTGLRLHFWQTTKLTLRTASFVRL